MKRREELLLLLRSVGPMSPKRATALINAPSHSVRTTVLKMRKEGLLHSPPDRQHIPLELTDEGRREADRLASAFAPMIQHFAGLVLTDELVTSSELDAARAIARRLYKALLDVYRQPFMDGFLLGGEVPDWLTKEDAE